jgi:hypothetical protein
MNNREGWVCPLCGRGVAPDVKVCPCVSEPVETKTSDPLEPFRNPEREDEPWLYRPRYQWPVPMWPPDPRKFWYGPRYPGDPSYVPDQYVVMCGNTCGGC